MSGFLAMLDLGGATVDGALLRRLAERMSYRGPHGSVTDVSFGSVGLAHTMLRSGDPTHDSLQPARLADRLALVADARLDDRRGLLAGIAQARNTRQHIEDESVGAATARADQGHVGDADLIVHAYANWGASCTERLLGDFSFALWDPANRRLFCARDQFGVKPLYFATFGSTFLVSNSLRCLRGHPLADDQLDERSIADYLVFSYNRYPDRSAFAGIHRLPPAHALCLDVAGGSVATVPKTRRYWSLPVEEPLRLPREEDYRDRFHQLIREAVADRSRERRIAVLMSGGIDSTTVAATASTLPGRDRRIEAFTYGYGELIDDEEPQYAALAASALGIRLHTLSLDADRTNELWRTADGQTPAPVAVPMTHRMDAFFRHHAPGTRVGLTGHGADAASHLAPEDAALWLRRRPLETTWRALQYRRRHGLWPRAGLRTAMRRRLSRVTLYRPVYPPWLRPDLEKRLGLRDRFDRLNTPSATPGAVRPTAHAILSSPDLSAVLESYDPGYTKFAADVRHPWLDLRLMRFMLRLPPIPWCVEKHLVRAAMASRLPRATLDRRKASLPGYPILDATLTQPQQAAELATRARQLADFVDIPRLQSVLRKPERLRSSEYEVVTRPLGMALWLRQFEEGLPNR